MLPSHLLLILSFLRDRYANLLCLELRRFADVHNFLPARDSPLRNGPSLDTTTAVIGHSEVQVYKCT